MKTLIDTEIGDLTTPTGDNQSTSSEPGNGDAQATIGELVTYQVVLTIPEGVTPGATILDQLDEGLALVDITGVTFSSGALSTSNGLTFANNGAANATTLTGNTGVGGSNNKDITFALGTITNTDNATAETITIRYRAVVLNTNSLPGDADGNQAGDLRNNAARFRWTNNNTTLGTVSAANVTLVGPTLATAKLVNNTTDGTGFQPLVSADAGDVLQYRVTLTNSNATGDTTAFDVTLADPLPPPLSAPTILSATSTGVIRFNGTARAATASDFVITPGGTLQFAAGLDVDIEKNAVISVTVQGTWTGAFGDVIPNTAEATPTGTTTLNNTATATTTSLPGTNGSLDTTPFFGTTATTLGASGTPTGERTGADRVGGALSDYAATATAKLGSVGDLVYLDYNANGVRNTGEPGIGSASVTVRWAGLNGTFGDGDDSVINTTTGANGVYTVGGLPVDTAGAYRVAVNDTTGPFVTFGLNTFTDSIDNGGTPNPVNPTTLTLTPAAPNPRDQDFGYRGTASLGDRVWIDSNGDGLQGPVALEPGLPAVGVTLVWAGVNNTFGDGDDLTLTTMTDQNGLYNFANLPAGMFRVTVVTGGAAGQVPGNMTPTFDRDGGLDNTADRTLATGEAATDVDFGYVGNASAGDRVWIDQDRDGVQDTGEPGIPGATVQLRWAGPDGTLGNTDDVFFTTKTGANGIYLFPGLPVYGASDDYRVTVTALPVAGLTPTYDLDSLLVAPDQTAAFVVSGADGDPLNDRRDVDFGYDGFGGLSGTVYNDLNNDGVQQGTEPGIAGVQLTLTGVDLFDNPILDPDTNQPYIATTDANGDYVFTTVIPGTYTIRETQPAAYNDGIDTSGMLGGSPTPNDLISGIVVGPGQSGTAYNFGEIGTFLSGTVFRDGDRDGALTAGEPGIAGVTLQLFAADGTTPANNPGTGAPYTATTSANGAYSFTGLAAGTYVVRETQPAGYADSPAGPALTRTAVVPLAGLPNQNFGEVLGSIAGRVYIDLNNDGTQQPGEGPLANVAVTLTGTDVNGAIAPVTLFTDANGNYRFDNLFAAADTGYTVSEGSAAPYTDAANNAPGSAGGTNTFTAVPLGVGQQGTNYNFGELPPATTFLAGTVYYDADRDGTRGAGETGIPNVTVTLNTAGADGVFGTFDDTTTTTTTDANGNYLFPNLTAGTPYLLTESQPGLYGSSTPNTISVPPLPAAGLTNQNFGETLGSIAGSVYFDANTSATCGAGEAGIGGVAVNLTGTDANGAAVTATTTTDTNGNYRFDALPAGTYVITELTQPAGYTDGQEALGTAGGVVGNDTFTAIPLGGGVNATGYDFGEIGVPVSGTAFRDDNRDGARMTGEPPLPGVQIQLIDANGNVVNATTTDGSGNYSFTNVPPGNFTLRERQPAGYGNPLVGTFAPDTRPITVTNAPITGQNFADTLSTLAGSVYVDANNDGIRQGGETGIANVPVALDSAGADGAFGTADDVLNFRTSNTDANGNYSFTLLPTGTYRVREVAQSAPYADGIDTAGNASGDTTTNDQITAVPVGAGADLTGYNFGELAPADPFIAGNVYLDANSNGTRDPGEVALPGVGVTLLGGPNLPVVVQTDAFGNYTFANLTTGAGYIVIETQPADYASGPQNASDIINVPNLPAAGSPNNNFGETPGTISGNVYFDRDASGTSNAGDTPLPAVMVALLDGTGAAVNNPLTGTPYVATTDVNGNYTFVNLPAGSYRVVETQPANFNQGTNAPGTFATLGGADRIDVALPAGGASVGNTFGEVGATISGRVYFDENADGTRQPGETTGLGGVLARSSTPTAARSIPPRPTRTARTRSPTCRRATTRWCRRSRTRTRPRPRT